MTEIRVVNAPPELVSQLDTLMTQTSFKDRSSFVIDILKQYCLYHNDYYINSLPDTTKILAEDALKSSNINLSKQLEYTLKVNQQCEKTLNQIVDLISGDF